MPGRRPQHPPYSRSRLSVQGVPAARPCPEAPEESSRAEKLHRDAHASGFDAAPENGSHNSGNSHGDKCHTGAWHPHRLLETSQPPEVTLLSPSSRRGRKGGRERSLAPRSGQRGAQAARACLIQKSNSCLTAALGQVRRARSPTVSRFPPGGASEGAHCAYRELVGVPRKVGCCPSPEDL